VVVVVVVGVVVVVVVVAVVVVVVVVVAVVVAVVVVVAVAVAPTRRRISVMRRARARLAMLDRLPPPPVMTDATFVVKVAPTMACKASQSRVGFQANYYHSQNVRRLSSSLAINKKARLPPLSRTRSKQFQLLLKYRASRAMSLSTASTRKMIANQSLHVSMIWGMRSDGRVSGMAGGGSSCVWEGQTKINTASIS
jgi:hypothetical protein